MRYQQDFYQKINFPSLITRKKHMFLKQVIAMFLPFPSLIDQNTTMLAGFVFFVSYFFLFNFLLIEVNGLGRLKLSQRRLNYEQIWERNMRASDGQNRSKKLFQRGMPCKFLERV